MHKVLQAKYIIFNQSWTQESYFDSHQWQMNFNSCNQYITHIAQDYIFKDKAKLKLSPK